MFKLPDGQTLPMFPQHRLRSPVLSIMSNLLPRDGECTVVELPKFWSSPGQPQSVLLAWNELVAEHVLMGAQNMNIEELLRLLMVRIRLFRCSVHEIM